MDHFMHHFSLEIGLTILNGGLSQAEFIENGDDFQEPRGSLKIVDFKL